MIRAYVPGRENEARKPRASGDDPDDGEVEVIGKSVNPARAGIILDVKGGRP